MKRLIFAVFFLALTVGLCIYQQSTLTTACNEIISISQEIRENPTVNSGEKLGDYWTKKYPCLSAMIDHTLLDEAGSDIKLIQKQIKDESDELEETLDNLESTMQLIYESQRITVGNVF